jgi:glycerol-3-phosphate dehydrogenase (NAD(P)+)
MAKWAILGAGVWGAALTQHLTRQDHSVVLWGHRDKVALADILQPDVDILIAVPSHAFQEIIQKIAAVCTPKRLLWATKGLSEQGEWLHQVAARVFPKATLAVLSGPSFAREVANNQPTAVVLACQDVIVAKEYQQQWMSETFRPYITDDMLGVQLGGVVKNVLAIAVGMSDGLQYGANARSALITRGLAEMMRLGEAVGARAETLMGLSGLGDLVLTATDNESRNRRFGVLLGQGLTVEAACQQVKQVVEGIYAARLLTQWARRYKIDMPITEQVYAVLRGDTSPKQAGIELLMRPL